MTNKEEIFDLINKHPDGLDDDDIAEMTGIQPRQQVQQLCNQLADSKRIRRQSVEKAGKRRKIHNFPTPRAERIGHPVRNGSAAARVASQTLGIDCCYWPYGSGPLGGVHTPTCDESSSAEQRWT
jgi:hypothetical protein